MDSERREELWGAQRTGGRKEARFWKVTATDRARCGGSVREHAAAASGVWQEHRPYMHVQARSKEAAASQEEDYDVVAEERPQGTASSPRSLFAWRQWIVREGGQCAHHKTHCNRRSLRPRPCSSGNTEHGSEEKMEGLVTWRGPSTECGSGSPVELM